jgi:RNA polymerase sigma-70 factor (ECF subfamily)
MKMHGAKDAHVSREDTEALYRPLRDKLLAFFGRYTGDREIAEDLTQTAFLRLFRRLEKEQDLVNTAAYLFATARNVLIDHYRTQRSEDELPEILDSSTNTADEDAVRREVASWLTSHVDRLPSPYAETLRLTELQNLKYTEVADILRIRLGTVKSRVHRGRNLIRRNLARCCRFEFDQRGRVIDYEPINRMEA